MFIFGSLYNYGSLIANGISFLLLFFLESVIDLSSRKRKRPSPEQVLNPLRVRLRSSNVIDLSSSKKPSSIEASSIIPSISVKPKVLFLSSGEASSSKNAKGKNVLIPGNDIEQGDDFNESLVTYRNPSGNISRIYGSFSKKRKEVVRSIGFGFMDSFVVTNFGSKICSWVLQNYDHNTNILYVNKDKIHITRQGVHDMYGLSMGKVVMKVPLKSHYLHPVISKWKAQFTKGNKGKKMERVRVTDLEKLLTNTSDSGDLFVLNFLVAYVTTMIDGPSMGTCNQKFLESFGEDENLSGLDWCGYVIDCLKQSKKNLKLDHKSTFSGPVAFLVVSFDLFNLPLFLIFLYLFFVIIWYVVTISSFHKSSCGRC